ncbi:MAG: DEAD/DEAH box helicase [Candidatus Omnitrophica bacterium]|nr:DEAD/DEAH box helicase [Candidatus Omnitrophota bacterium]
MMALRLDPVRLLIADDVGIGKTVEAALIARELLDRGEIHRLAVLCPPHLAEQWQKELIEKFHIEAELVLSSTIQRLERDLPIGLSVFDRHPYTIVSTDFIKSTRRADDFELKCPEFVIVDEAHGCTLAGGVGRGRQQRFELSRRIASRGDRHIVLVTATPHSGNEQAFRSLLGLLDEEFFDLPHDIVQEEREGVRRKLARHLLQRRRADIQHYLETDTSFPKRLDKEETYAFSKEYRLLFDDILNFLKEYISEGASDKRHRRVRYWSALALLRCVSSSPAAAAATLRSRAAVDTVASDVDLDEVGRRTVLDQDVDDTAFIDLIPGSESEDDAEKTRRKLLEFARRAETLDRKSDNKLQGAISAIKSLLKDGFQPIIFCRFVNTAEYVAQELREALPEKVRVESVTGLLPPEEREARIKALIKDSSDNRSYVLVCTDCLSEGVNLQQGFNAVLHYDLCWNPTRHEQREGRVDRFGQRKTEVRVITYFGKDNPIDGVILDVLIRKHKSIKSDLGVTVAVPGSSEQIAETLFEGSLFKEMTRGSKEVQLKMDFIDEASKTKIDHLHHEWDSARDKEKASRSRFAQHALDKDTVAAELNNVREAIGRAKDIELFFREVLKASRVPFEEGAGTVSVHVSEETPRALRQAMGRDEKFKGRFDLPLQEGEIYLCRTSPMIEGLAGWTLDQALDPSARDSRPIASRCGVVRTSSVKERTTLIVVRFRYNLRVSGLSSESILCEEIVPLACSGTDKKLNWLSSEESEILMNATPEKNLVQSIIDQQGAMLFDAFPSLQECLGVIAKERAKVQLSAHERVREALRSKRRVTIEPVSPVDILGAYILLPRL